MRDHFVGVHTNWLYVYIRVPSTLIKIVIMDADLHINLWISFIQNSIVTFSTSKETLPLASSLQAEKRHLNSFIYLINFQLTLITWRMNYLMNILEQWMNSNGCEFVCFGVVTSLLRWRKKIVGVDFFLLHIRNVIAIFLSI